MAVPAALAVAEGAVEVEQDGPDGGGVGAAIHAGLLKPIQALSPDTVATAAGGGKSRRAGTFLDGGCRCGTLRKSARVVPLGGGCCARRGCGPA